MPSSVQCPHCFATVRTTDSARREVPCPECGELVPVLAASDNRGLSPTSPPGGFGGIPVRALVAGGVLTLLMAGAVGLFVFGRMTTPKPGDESSPDDAPALTRENVETLKLGMVYQGVRLTFDREGQPATEFDLYDTLRRIDNGQHSDLIADWKPLFHSGAVLKWTNGPNRLLVGFEKTPHDFTPVKAVVAVTGSGPTKWSTMLFQRRPEDMPTEWDVVGTLKEYAADANAADTRYRGKAVQLRGEVKAVTPFIILRGTTIGGVEHEIQLTFRPDQRVRQAAIREGETVTVIGKVSFFTPYGNARKTLTVTDCKVVD